MSTATSSQPMQAQAHLPQRTPAFIVGTGRCGTTLLQAVLSAHPQVETTPETLFFIRFDPAVAFDDPLGDDQVEPYLTRIRAERPFDELKLDRDRFEQAVRSGVRSAAELCRWFLREITGIDDNQILFVEKTPGHQKYVHRILAAFPDARIIHIHRDPRDVVASLERAPFFNRTTTTEYARYYRRVIRRQNTWARRLGPDQHLTVRYESLVSELEPQIHRLCAFLGIPFDARMLEHHAQVRSTPFFLERETDLKEFAREPITRSRMGTYRKHLSDRAIAAVERTVGPGLMRSLGYEPDPEVKRRASWAVLDSLNEARLRAARSIRRTLGIKVRAEEG